MIKSYLHKSLWAGTSLVFSLFLFLIIFSTISYFRSHQENLVETKDVMEVEKRQGSSLPQLDFNLIKYQNFLDCMDSVEIDSPAHCKEKKNISPVPPKEYTLKKTSFKAAILANLLKSNPLIKLVYIGLIFSLAIPIYVALITRFCNIELTDQHHYMVEYGLNSAPMFGILGTFLSLATLFNGSEQFGISDKLLGSFFDAVMTSIIGIIFYIICLFTKILIHPKDQMNA